MRSFHFKVVGWFVVVLAWGVAARAREPVANGLAPDRAAAVDRVLQTALTQQKLVGLAVGILEEGRIVYLQGYGEADRAQRIPVTIRTKFNWASNSKPVAAVLAMHLVAQQRLDLDADVRTYVPEFPDKGAVLTPRYLLCHQSGLPHYANGKVLGTPRTYDRPDPFAEPVFALDKFNQSPLIFIPGEKVSYSSYAYILLSAVIERAGAQPFFEQVRERVIAPLGLESFDPDTGGRRPEHAVGYALVQGEIAPAVDADQYWKHGAGGFRSDIHDFALWAEALLNRRLVSEQAEEAMWSVQATKDGSPTAWGLGFGINLRPSGLRVSHGGAQPETRTQMVLYPKSKRGLVLMSNSGYADVVKLSAAVEAALAPPAAPPEPQP